MGDVCCSSPTDPGILYFQTVVGMEASKCICLFLEGECTQICKICQNITVITQVLLVRSLISSLKKKVKEEAFFVQRYRRKGLQK